MASAPGTPGGGREAGDTDMSRTYALVIVIWAAVLAALYALQQYFTN